MRADECLKLPGGSNEKCGPIPQKCEFDEEDLKCKPT